MTDSPTDRALAVFDTFLTQWMPPAVLPLLFGHEANAADLVRHAIRGIEDQRQLPLAAGPFGYAVYSQHHDREAKDGWHYDIESAVFDTADKAENAYKYLPDKGTATGLREVHYVIGEIRKQP